jgi:outer membrane scaffolding protein for murein synthesis (MipA/OmpV family)
MFEPKVPEWRVVLGAATEVEPAYEGASAYRTQAGPVINVRYKDLLFASTGEGLGINFLSGDNYRVGAGLGYDLGRKVRYEYSHLHGLGDISPAPLIKLFGSYVISKGFPLVLRVDARQIIGGADGLVGDIGMYMPLPGSSKKLAMFAGPSFTFANRRYLQKTFGVSEQQSEASGYPQFDAHTGADVVGFGFSATRFITDRWLVNADLAWNHLLGSAGDSPITERDSQGVIALSVAYSW